VTVGRPGGAPADSISTGDAPEDHAGAPPGSGQGVAGGVDRAGPGPVAVLPRRPGPLDVAAALPIRLALFPQPSRQREALQRYGVSPWAGQPPARQARPGSGWRDWARVREVLREASLASGPPASLLAGVEMLARRMPASAGRLALLLLEAGLTERPVHPRSLVLAGL